MRRDGRLGEYMAEVDEHTGSCAEPEAGACVGVGAVLGSVGCSGVEAGD